MNSNKETYKLDIDSEIAEYVKNNNPKICILTPCYGGMCYVSYMCCLMNTKEILQKYNIGVKFEFCKGDSLVSRARNNLIAKAMSDPSITHIFFIDSDISWDPVNVLKLLLADKPIIGGIYPLKNYDWNKLVNNKNHVNEIIEKKNKSLLKDVVDDDLLIQHSMLTYNLNYKSKNISIKKNLIEVKHIATGFMMMKRELLESMFKEYPDTKYTDDVHFLNEHENNFAYALFDCGVEDDHYLSEDWMFCNRWSKIGGELFVDISINLTHTGIENFNGSFITSLL